MDGDQLQCWETPYKRAHYDVVLLSTPSCLNVHWTCANTLPALSSKQSKQQTHFNQLKKKQVPNNQKSVKKIIKRNPPQIRDKALKTPFLNALMNPFDPISIGCTVPDPFPFPTVQYHLHQTTVVGPPPNSLITSGGMMFFPNPILSMVDLTHTGFTTSLGYSVQSTSMTPYSTSGTSAASPIYGATTPYAMANLFSAYRVVSWGVKVSNLQPELTATGRLMYAYVPLGDTIPSYVTLLNSSVSPLLDATGVNSAVLNSSAILDLPTASELTVGDLLHGDLQLSGMYTNSVFWSMKNTVFQGSAPGFSIGDEVQVATATNTVVGTGYKDDTRCVGGCAIVIYYEGLPLPGGISNAFQFETIYHLEGSPALSSSTTSVPVPSSPMKTNTGPMAAVESSMVVASNENNVVKWISKGANFLDKHKSDIKAGFSLIKSAAQFAMLA